MQNNVNNFLKMVSIATIYFASKKGKTFGSGKKLSKIFAPTKTKIQNWMVFWNFWRIDTSRFLSARNQVYFFIFGYGHIVKSLVSKVRSLVVELVGGVGQENDNTWEWCRYQIYSTSKWRYSVTLITTFLNTCTCNNMCTAVQLSLVNFVIFFIK